MLEGLVAWVLNNYLGKYVENLNTDQLSVALLSGKVELENLPLKKEALRHLGLPVEVKAGFIGKVQLHVPVRQIRSAPWLIAIEKLYLVAAPVNLDEWDSAVEAAYSHERKVALLDALEAQWRAEHEANDAGYYATSYSSWLSYGTGLLANIVENLQLKLNDVHIRYEDALTCPGHAFACGLTAESLAAESCDASWRRGFTPLADPCSFKLLELQNLAIYWDPMQVPAGMLADCTIAELTERMCGTWKSTHSYMVFPTGANARVRRERCEQPLRDRHRPRLAAHLTLDSVLLRLTSRQYGEACGCASGLERVARLRELRALRPAQPLRGNARAWWRYALRAHLPHHTWMDPKPTWESCLERARQARQYVDICYEILCNPAGTLPPERKAAKDEFECNTPLAVLKPLREIAMRRVPVSTPASTPEQASSGRSVLVRWFPQWWGWYAPSAEPPVAAPTPGEPAPAPTSGPAPAPRLEDEILDVIADSLDDNTLLRRDALFGLFEFTLHRGSLDLCDHVDDAAESPEGAAGARGSGVELQFSLVRARVESRPRAGAHALHVSLGALVLRDRVTPRTLFPVLVAPQGLIRDGLSAMNAAASAAAWWRAQQAPQGPSDPLFQLSYERRPAGLNCDYKLRVRWTSLEVVWCAAVAQWARRWAGAGSALASVRTRTRATLSHWGRLLHAPARTSERRSWHVELDISAPQILFVEELCARDAAVLVVDFGRLRLANAENTHDQNHDLKQMSMDDDEEMFMTPCSTPPGSLLSPGSPPAPAPPPRALDPAHLHTSLYDRYRIELSDLQILVGRARDNWKYAHTKATSPLHLLDRFSISLQAERRVLPTADPQYPGAALCGSLPALVAHLSEHKLAAVRAVLSRALPAAPAPPDRHETPSGSDEESEDEEGASESSRTEPSDAALQHNATLFILQFAIDQMSLEVQSRGRSIAEVQVCGVRAALSARPADVALSLSVHSLLLVDALQTYGPDFELLVASHRHLGMDTASGSIRGSEPTSPTSPASPGGRAPSPLALHRALYSLHAHGTHDHLDVDRTSPAPAWGGADWGVGGVLGPASDTIWGTDVFGWNSGDVWPAGEKNWGPGVGWGPDGAGWSAPGLVDSEALIAMELCLVKGEGDSEDLRIANILFNNLDVIANQETIVELIGFGHRVCGAAPAHPEDAPGDTSRGADAPETPATPSPRPLKRTRTEITFDFHRLGVLLLRTSVRDAAPAAHKLATATVGDARIQATLDGERVEVGGSLGGVQVVSLCESAGVHSRVLTAGRVPPAPAQPPASRAAAPPPAPHADRHGDDEKALLFSITRTLTPSEDGDGTTVEVAVSVRVASVWYTHSGPLLRELRSCAAQFRRYLAELARSVRAAAADMALGLVQARAEPLYANARLAHSLDGLSPRRRVASLSLDDDGPDSLIVLSVSVELESPVVVLPRAARSPQVAVAHLGRMSLANRPGPPRATDYSVRVRDISLVSLDIAEKLRGQALSATDSMADIYDVARGRPVLHEAALRLALACAPDRSPQYELSGAVVGGLHVTASREQYEQLLETLRWMAEAPGSDEPSPVPPPQPTIEARSLAEGAVPTLRLEPALRAALQPPPPPAPSPPAHAPLLVTFELASFTVELRADLGGGERSLVALTCREFALRHEHLQPHETTLQVSLHSITMEDLTQPPESAHRMLMVSHSPPAPRKAVFVSASCPDFVSELRARAAPRTRARSLPAQPAQPACSGRLGETTGLKPAVREHRCGVTPPSSPVRAADDNLVWVCVRTRQHADPSLDSDGKVSKTTKVEFNCLKLVLSIDSWVAVLDFFGVAGDEPDPPAPPDGVQTGSGAESASGGGSGAGEALASELELCVRSLWVVVVGARGDACRAHVSRVRVLAASGGAVGGRDVRAQLGALALTDLAPRAVLWRDRLRTRTKNALNMHYRRLGAAEAAAEGYETSLSLEMGPLMYVHTRRFVLELQAFATDFSLLRRVIVQARRKVSSAARSSWRAARMSLSLRCAAPVIVLPVSGRSRAALAAELQLLTLTNRFCRAGDPDTVSSLRDPDAGERELLDVRAVRAEGLSLWCVRGGAGGGALRRSGAPLLPAPAELCLQLERNCSETHNVADVSVHGRLTTLQMALDAAQYRLVRGVLAHNLAEPCEELLPPPRPGPAPLDQVWTTWSLRLELQDVSLQLRMAEAACGAEPGSLACINFIKSRLLIESYSDLSQDIDLVSQEILVSDTRYATEPANRRANVFSHIVAPLPEQRHSVQAEVHARKRLDSSAYTILINNMRLMAILDWWEAANQFIMQAPLPASDPDLQHLEESPVGYGEGPAGRAGTGVAEGAEGAAVTELKLNVTDSQLVLVEDTSVWDTNAVILKCSTVVTYRSAATARPVVCELSELELFSCVLGLEEETALAIVDPAAAHLALHADGLLHIAMGTLNLRLSYHDMRMFAAILQSLPVQARLALSGKSEEEPPANEPANSVHMHAGAGAGFNKGAGRALNRWMRDAPAPAQPPPPRAPWPLRSVQVSAENVTLCVIDDCLDSDVPLLEVTLADLHLDQDLRKAEESFEDPLLVSTPSGVGPVVGAGGGGARGAGGGRVRAVLSVDYYNRPLSGWEPVLEPWRFETWWEYTLSSSLTRARLQLEVSSAETLHTNVTSALVDLAALVRTNWTADYYAPQAPRGSPKGSPAGHRRRSPFVPYALRNLTGQRLWFATLTTAVDELRESGEEETWGGPDDTWVMVRAGDTEPFSFGGRRPRAPSAAAPAPLHRLVLRLDQWTPPDPVCVDRVGVFFRDITHVQSGGHARVVLEVSLEGSARKLVTIRSALLLLNRLPHAVELRLDRAPAAGAWGGVVGSSGAAGTVVEAGARWAAPLVARAGVVWARPVLRGRPAPPPAAIDWRAAQTDQPALLHHECRTANDQSYRFSCVVVRERFPTERGEPLAGHTLTLLPALRLENLLPLELQYRADGVGGALPPAHTQPFHQVNVEEGVELSVKLEGFGWSSALVVGGPGTGGSFSARLKMRDQRGRRLYLNARVTIKKSDGIKVSVSAAYWLVNRTGLPLVFRAEGGAEAAGQFAEHELARMVAPLPFAFADGDGPTLSARLGSALSPRPEWCSPFGLGPGVTVKRLETAGLGAEGERSFAVGVHVRAGRGRHRRTNVVTLTPRYQLHNNTSRCLQFAQKCTATTLNDPGAVATHVSAVAGCYLPWHWARWEREQLLSVRVLAPPPAGSTSGSAPTTPLTAWSGGFRIDKTRSIHVACRESGGTYQVLRVEVVSQGATLLVVLTDAECAPPPLRLDNRSPVAVMFHQVGCAEECVAGAGGGAVWALPEPEGAQALALRAPGGPRLTLPLDALHTPHTLLYQNFLYVAFTRSRESSATSAKAGAADDNVLVLEVPMGSTRVVLARKRYGDRSQLWRRGPNDQLVHEGSSPPQPTDVLSDDTALSPHAMVLDIEEAAPRPGRAAALVLRRADPRRASTQAWRLLPGARMACAHANLCVQPDAGLLGLTPGNRVVLGMPGSPRAGGAVPPEQAVEWHTLRPGSGRLTVTLSTDGPTRLVRIYDQNDAEAQRAVEGAEEDGSRDEREWCVGVSLAGVSVSLVARAPPAELVYAQLLGLHLELARRPRTARLALTVRDMQWDNQLAGSPSPVLLHSWGGAGAGPGAGPALHAALELQRAPPRSYNAVYCNHLVLALRPLAVRLEERLILLLWAWAARSEEEAQEQPDEAEYETRRVLHELTALHATRYYFALVKIIPGQIRLSMFTANKLEGELSALKRRLGLTLIRFEDAAVELEPFVRAHAFDTAACLARQMLQHFKDELKWQAAKILGSVDFLGNPLGFVADVSEGVSGLLLEGNVGALLKNVTHGISNSAAKVSETLGDGLERVVGDEAHEETRRRIRAAAAGAHLAAGLRGLGLGLLGGVTSLVKHSYEGAAAEGLPGFLTGVGKGLVGTVTKPVIGVLDLAAETAAAVRDSSRRAGAEPQRARPPRPVAADAPLPRYCERAARGAQLLRALARDPAERFLAYRIVRDTPHDIRAILSDTHLRIFTIKGAVPQLVMETPLGGLVSCAAVCADGAWFVELGVRGAAGEGVRRPRVQCDSSELAGWLARHAAHARRLHHDRAHTLLPRTP